jgi:hypothetical protein
MIRHLISISPYISQTIQEQCKKGKEHCYYGLPHKTDSNNEKESRVEQNQQALI